MGKIVDKNDFWFIERNPITKVGVFPYLGKQISQDCEPDKIYYVLRPKEELSKKETLDSLKLLPLVDEHTMLGKDFTPAEEKGIDGILGEKVIYDNGTIYTDIKIFSEDMKEKIREGKKELSLGYFCTYDKQEGVYNGQRYDYVQKNIIGNHLALVDKGRMGSDVRVYDKAVENKMYCCDSLENIDIEKMKYKKNIGEDKMTKLEQFLTGKISQDEMEEVKKIVEQEKEEKDEDDVEEKKEEKAKDCGKKCGKDEEGKEEEKAKDEDEKEKEKTEDEDEEKKEGEDEEEEKKDDKKGMDEGTVIKMIAKREKLAKDVEDVLGAFDHSEMTELEVAKYACDKLDLSAEKGQEISTLKGYLKGVKKSKVAVTMKAEDSFTVVEDKSFDNYLKNAKK